MNRKVKKLINSLLLTVCLLLACKLFFSFATPYVISSASMGAEYPVNSIIFVKKEPFKNLTEGDVIVYKSRALGGGLAFHRIVRVTEEGVYTKGDKNNFEDNQLITEETYVGKEFFKITLWARFLSGIQSPRGFVVYAVLPVLSICILLKYFAPRRKKT